MLNEFDRYHPKGICRCRIWRDGDIEQHVATIWFWEESRWCDAGWTINKAGIPEGLSNHLDPEYLVSWLASAVRPLAVRSFRHGQGGKRFSDWPRDDSGRDAIAAQGDQNIQSSAAPVFAGQESKADRFVTIGRHINIGTDITRDGTCERVLADEQNERALPQISRLRLSKREIGERHAEILMIADHKFAGKSAHASAPLGDEFQDDLLPKHLRDAFAQSPYGAERARCTPFNHRINPLKPSQARA